VVVAGVPVTNPERIYKNHRLGRIIKVTLTHINQLIKNCPQVRNHPLFGGM